MSATLAGKVSLVTGASRGIGADTARKLAGRGSDVVLNYRSKTARAELVAQEIEALGRVAVMVQADLTIESELANMMAVIRERFGRLDVVILNASGGLEKGKAEDYAMTLNHTAQLNTARFAASLMPAGGRIVFVTSHWAHFYGEKPVIPEYEVVARSKHAGERALRDYATELDARGISLVVVSGDAIEGTITPRLLNRMHRGLKEVRSSEEKRLPTIDEFAEVISQAACDPALPTGKTLYVGSTDY